MNLHAVDNFSKGTQNATFTIDVAKSSGAKQVVFISSAGMYKGSGKVYLIMHSIAVESLYDNI